MPRQLLRNGQTTAEYAILISVAIAALIGMQAYVRRGLNSRWHDVSDGASAAVIGKLGLSNKTEYKQYEPYYAKSNYDVIQQTGAGPAGATIVKEEIGGVMKRENIHETTDRTGTEDIKAPE